MVESIKPNKGLTNENGNASDFYDSEPEGETIKVLRHGKPIAEVVPASDEERTLSWKQPGLRLSVKGAYLSKEILRERKQSKR